MNEKTIKLKDNIWKTRKARINASERLLSKANFIKFLNVYYSCVLIILSIIDITSSSIDMSVESLCLSIILTISLVYLDSQLYLDRANDLKKNYIDLQKLINEINDENCDKISEEYIKLLEKTENHTEYDYYKVLIDNGILELKPIKYIYYYLRKFGIMLLKLSLILAPVLALYGLI